MSDSFIPESFSHKYLWVLCFWTTVVSGYTQEEKLEISHRHLIPNQLEQHGLTPQQLHIPQETTQGIISRYHNVLSCKTWKLVWDKNSPARMKASSTLGFFPASTCIPVKPVMIRCDKPCIFGFHLRHVYIFVTPLTCCPKIEHHKSSKMLHCYLKF